MPEDSKEKIMGFGRMLDWISERRRKCLDRIDSKAYFSEEDKGMQKRKLESLEAELERMRREAACEAEVEIYLKEKIEIDSCWDNYQDVKMEPRMETTRRRRSGGSLFGTTEGNAREERAVQMDRTKQRQFGGRSPDEWPRWRDAFEQAVEGDSDAAKWYRFQNVLVDEALRLSELSDVPRDKRKAYQNMCRSSLIEPENSSG
eukprot:GHVS01058917.1.p1 GENE.GHVS01058917.1~~GHVS01058917.1.p1  ORF type:complete len:203 (+),score=23.83 GHVS01058917.1:189-797(+)